MTCRRGRSAPAPGVELEGTSSGGGRASRRGIAGERSAQKGQSAGQPFLVERFLALRTRLAEPGDSDRVRRLYARLAAADFSRQVLGTRPPNLAVLPMTGVHWSDLNHPERAGLALSRAGIALASMPASLSA